MPSVVSQRGPMLVVWVAPTWHTGSFSKRPDKSGRGYTCMGIDTACLLLLLTPAQAQGAPVMDVRSLARANTAALQAIHSIMVRVEISDDLPDEGSSRLRSRPELNYTFVWYKQGEDERLRETHQRPNANRFLRSNDRYNGKRGFKELINYDPEHPSELSESTDGGAAGVLAGRRPPKKALQFNPRIPLLMALGHAGRFYSLEEFIAEAIDVSLEKTPAQSEWKCYEMRVRFPDYNFQVAVDPTANFLIRRLHIQPTDTNKTLPDVSQQSEVHSFNDCGKGVYLPAKVVRKRTNTKLNISSTLIAQVTEYTVNQTLPPEAFDITFPEWLRVTDRETNKVHVWDKDGPRLTFSSAEEYTAWFGPRMKPPQKARSLSWPIWTGIAMAAVLVAAGCVRLFMRWRARKRLA